MTINITTTARIVRLRQLIIITAITIISISTKTVDATATTTRSSGVIRKTDNPDNGKGNNNKNSINDDNSSLLLDATTTMKAKTTSNIAATNSKNRNVVFLEDNNGTPDEVEEDVKDQQQRSTNRRNGSPNNNGGFLRQSDYPFLSSKVNDQWTSVSKNVEFLPIDDEHNYNNYQKLLQQIQSSNGDDKERQPNLHDNRDDESALDGKEEDEEDKEEDEEESTTLLSGSSGSTSTTRRRLKNNKNSDYDSFYTNYASQPFVDGEVEYDSYQQAWRMLGFMIDCDTTTSSYNNNEHNSRDNGDYLTGTGCQRYVIWAAYVDLEYEGGGIGEYMYWNRETNDWDDTACRHGQSNSNNNNNRNNRNNKNNNKNNNDNDGYYDSRCAKMDCHLSSTHFKLLGFFKHKSYDDWMEQLFKHEGMCVWSDDEYSFMKNARKAWPSGCTVSQVQTTSDNGQQQQIYYDLKPTTGGGITLGLYTDTKCIVEYVSWGSNDPITVENVAGNILANSGGGSHDNNNNDNANSDYTFKQSLQMWDQSFDAFKVCQPCVAHDLNNYGYNTDDDASHGSSYGSYRYGYDDDYKWYYYGQNKGSDFDCYDDAGYTNVNQCMKFMAKTTMNTATLRDLSLASSQGTLVGNPLSSFRKEDYSSLSAIHPVFVFFKEIVFLSVSLCIFFYGFIQYRKATRGTQPAINLKEPLMFA